MSNEDTKNKVVGGFIDYNGATKIVPLAEITLRKYVSKGTLPHYKFGSRVYFKPAELIEWMETCHVIPRLKVNDK